MDPQLHADQLNLVAAVWVVVFLVAAGFAAGFLVAVLVVLLVVFLTGIFLFMLKIKV